MIACGYCGRENDAAATYCRECGTELPSLSLEKAPQDAPQELPAPRFIKPDALEPAFAFGQGFHRTDWSYVRRWISSNIDPLDLNDAWSEAALLWVAKLRDDLGGDYFVVQSRQTILLCDRPLEAAQWILDYAGRAATSIKNYLGNTAWRGAMGKYVVLIFSDQDDYYQYLAYHTPDGEQATSGGMCIHSGYTHIALPWRDNFYAANTIVHELTHSSLAHLRLPLWLNEGVTVTLQRAVAPRAHPVGRGEQNALFADLINWRPPIMWDELAERHFNFWNTKNIQSFWAGTSFFQPGDPNELSYSLAEVFAKLLSERGSAGAFHAFLEAARREDAGQTAAMNILGTDLGEIAGTFLGEGVWRPQRKALIECWQAAGWKKSGSGGKATSTEDHSGLPK